MPSPSVGLYTVYVCIYVSLCVSLNVCLSHYTAASIFAAEHFRTYVGVPLIVVQFYAMIVKRLLYARRNSITTSIQLFTPICFALVVVLSTYREPRYSAPPFTLKYVTQFPHFYWISVSEYEFAVFKHAYEWAILQSNYCYLKTITTVSDTRCYTFSIINTIEYYYDVIIIIVVLLHFFPLYLSLSSPFVVVILACWHSHVRLLSLHLPIVPCCWHSLAASSYSSS